MRNSYYDALRSSQAGWHEGRHDLWPWAGYLLRLLADAYDYFERHVVGQRSLRGATKERQARDFILNHAPREFRSAAVVAALPDISPATVRNALIGLRDEGLVTSTRGRSAVWRRVDVGTGVDTSTEEVLSRLDAEERRHGHEPW